jgi:hypothetical protein
LEDHKQFSIISNIASLIADLNIKDTDESGNKSVKQISFKEFQERFLWDFPIWCQLYYNWILQTAWIILLSATHDIIFIIKNFKIKDFSDSEHENKLSLLAKFIESKINLNIRKSFILNNIKIDKQIFMATDSEFQFKDFNKNEVISYQNALSARLVWHVPHWKQIDFKSVHTLDNSEHVNQAEKAFRGAHINTQFMFDFFNNTALNIFNKKHHKKILFFDAFSHILHSLNLKDRLNNNNIQSFYTPLQKFQFQFIQSLDNSNITSNDLFNLALKQWDQPLNDLINNIFSQAKEHLKHFEWNWEKHSWSNAKPCFDLNHFYPNDLCHIIQQIDHDKIAKTKKDNQDIIKLSYKRMDDVASWHRTKEGKVMKLSLKNSNVKNVFNIYEDNISDDNKQNPENKQEPENGVMKLIKFNSGPNYIRTPRPIFTTEKKDKDRYWKFLQDFAKSHKFKKGFHTNTAFNNQDQQDIYFKEFFGSDPIKTISQFEQQDDLNQVFEHKLREIPNSPHPIPTMFFDNQFNIDFTNLLGNKDNLNLDNWQEEWKEFKLFNNTVIDNHVNHLIIDKINRIKINLSDVDPGFNQPLFFNISNQLFFVAHFNPAESSLINDWDSLKINNIDIISKSYVTINKPIIHNNYNVYFRDTALLASVTNRTLDAIGESHNIPKIKLDNNIINNMKTFLQDNPNEFKKYAVRDATITLFHTLFITDIANSIGMRNTPITLASLAKKFILNNWEQAKYKGYQHNPEFNFENFDNLFTPKGLNQSGKLACAINPFIAAYKGGRNEALMIGHDHNSNWFDFDLQAAYTTAMVNLGNPDYNNIKFVTGDPKLIDNHTLLTSYSAFYVNFSFDNNVRYPVCPTTPDKNTTVYSSQGNAWITGPELIVAKNLKAKINIIQGYIIPWEIGIVDGKTDFINKPFHDSIINILHNRHKAKLSHGKKSAMERIWKDIGNMIYGSVVAGISNKRKFDARTQLMKKINGGVLTNPIIGSYITGFIRALLGEILNNINIAYPEARIASVTTDGFVTDAFKDIFLHIDKSPKFSFRTDTEIFEEEIAKLPNSILLNTFKNNRADIFDSNDALELKCKVKGISQWNTRGQLSHQPDLSYPEKPTHINAMTGFQKHSFSQQELTQLIINKNINNNSFLFNQQRLNNATDIFKHGGNVTMNYNTISFKTVFDMRRKVWHDQENTTLFQTLPWNTPEEASLFRSFTKVGKNPIFVQNMQRFLPKHNNSFQFVFYAFFAYCSILFNSNKYFNNLYIIKNYIFDWTATYLNQKLNKARLNKFNAIWNKFQIAYYHNIKYLAWHNIEGLTLNNKAKSFFKEANAFIIHTIDKFVFSYNFINTDKEWFNYNNFIKPYLNYNNIIDPSHPLNIIPEFDYNQKIHPYNTTVHVINDNNIINVNKHRQIYNFVDSFDHLIKNTFIYHDFVLINYHPPPHLNPYDIDPNFGLINYDFVLIFPKDIIPYIHNHIIKYYYPKLSIILYDKTFFLKIYLTNLDHPMKLKTITDTVIFPKDITDVYDPNDPNDDTEIHDPNNPKWDNLHKDDIIKDGIEKYFENLGIDINHNFNRKKKINKIFKDTLYSFLIDAKLIDPHNKDNLKDILYYQNNIKQGQTLFINGNKVFINKIYKVQSFLHTIPVFYIEYSFKF